jgi:adenine deaminase
MVSVIRRLYRPFPAKSIEEYKRLLPRLIEVARGSAKADFVIRNTNFVDVVLGEVVEGVSVAVYKGFVVGVVDSRRGSIYIGDETLVIDSRELFLAPSFIDARVHIESSMLNIENFSRVAISHGVTTVVTDPHEVANVGGARHVHIFALRASKQLLKILVQVPSCVPPTSPSVDNPGAAIGIREIEELFSTRLFHSLGEFIDFPSVVQTSPEALKKLLMRIRALLQSMGTYPQQTRLCLTPMLLHPSPLAMSRLVLERFWRSLGEVCGLC